MPDTNEEERRHSPLLIMSKSEQKFAQMLAYVSSGADIIDITDYVQNKLLLKNNERYLINLIECIFIILIKIDSLLNYFI